MVLRAESGIEVPAGMEIVDSIACLTQNLA